MSFFIFEKQVVQTCYIDLNGSNVIKNQVILLRIDLNSTTCFVKRTQISDFFRLLVGDPGANADKFPT